MRDGVTPAAGMKRQEAAAAASSAPVGQRRRVGRYELLFELARGGMGAVWVARLHGAHGFDRFVAMKSLEKTSAGASERLNDRGDDETRTLFLEEAKIAARIHHPSVVQTLELFEHEGEPFIVMELVRGVSLARLLDRLDRDRSPMPPELAAWIVMLVASGLHAAHELRDRSGAPLGLVHRDVSPQNVLLSFDGRPYVADFGIAKFRRESLSTQSGIVKGKFSYMSPEQAQGLPLDRRSDVFSLGIVFYEALTNKRLYPSELPAEAIAQIIHAAPRDPRTARDDVPPELAAIATKCLQKKPEDRYATADELRSALRAALQSIAQSRPATAGADEQRLAELLTRSFRQDDEALRRRLEATDAPEEPTAAASTSDVVVDVMPTEISNAPVIEFASGERRIEAGAKAPDRDDVLSTRPSSRLRANTITIALGAVLVIVVAIAFVRSRSSTTHTTTPTQAPSTTVAATASSPTPAPTPAEPSAVTMTPSPPPPSSPSSTASARTTTMTTRRPGFATPHAVHSATSTPAPAPSSSSAKGVLFKDL